MDWVNAVAKINNKFKFQLFGRSYENLLHFYAIIPKYDPQHQGDLSQHAFNLLLNATGVFLTTQQIRIIKDQFPHEHGINYMLFLANVRNDLTQKRMAAIDHVYVQFQTNGKLSLNALIQSLSFDKHPHVRSLSKKKEKAQFDIESGLKYWSKDNTSLSYEDWLEFCKDINATIPLQRQEFFIDLLVHSFRLFQDSVSFERIQQLQVTIFEKVRQRTQIKKDEGWTASNFFKFLDIQEKGVIDYQTFVGILDRLGCNFVDKERKAVFYKHSLGSNILSYENLCGLLFSMGSGNKDNKNVAFEMSRGANGHITTHGMTKKLH